jgi:hypothetical protein
MGKASNESISKRASEQPTNHLGQRGRAGAWGQGMWGGGKGGRAARPDGGAQAGLSCLLCFILSAAAAASSSSPCIDYDLELLLLI